MVGKVEIANMALDFIGKSPIQSFTEESSSAELINRSYDKARTDLLQSYEWSFAKGVEELAASTVDPVDTKWAYSFQVPSDYLKMIKLVGIDKNTEWERQGQSIYINSSELTIVYLKNLQDSTKFSSQFDTALAYLIASRIAYPATKKRELMQDMLQGFIMASSMARGTDGGERQLENNIGHSFLDARN